MDAISAQKIVDDWKLNYWEGRIKTQTVVAAENFLQGKRPRTVTIEERHKQLYKIKKNESQNTKRRAKQLKRFLVHNFSNSNDGYCHPNISTSNLLDAIPDKHFRIIVEVVAKTYRYNVYELLGVCRNSDLVLARFIVIYLADFYKIGQLKYIGTLARRVELEPMNHATVIHARDTISARISKEVVMRSLVNNIINQIDTKMAIEKAKNIEV